METTQKFYDTVSPFLYPVEDIIAAIPDYARLIKQPIDLLKIKARLEAGDYEDFQQVDADMRLMIRNAKTFNPPQEPVHQCAVQLASVWDEKLKSMPAKQEARDLSEDPLADDFIDDASDEEDGESTPWSRADVSGPDCQAREASRHAAAANRRHPHATRCAQIPSEEVEEDPTEEAILAQDVTWVRHERPCEEAAQVERCRLQGR